MNKIEKTNDIELRNVKNCQNNLYTFASSKKKINLFLKKRDSNENDEIKEQRKKYFQYCRTKSILTSLKNKLEVFHKKNEDLCIEGLNMSPYNKFELPYYWNKQQSISRIYFSNEKNRLMKDSAYESPFRNFTLRTTSTESRFNLYNR